ncbi:MAG: hypothetical protein ACYCQI_15865 [Gammaproteobacteria bacterium]
MACGRNGGSSSSILSFLNWLTGSATTKTAMPLGAEPPILPNAKATNADQPEGHDPFSPIANAEKQFGKALTELDHLEKEFIELKDKIKAQAKVSESKVIVSQSEATAELMKVDPTASPLEKKIEGIIHKYQEMMKKSLSLLEQKSVVSDLEKCNACLDIADKLFVMTHELHVVITQALPGKTDIAEKWIGGIDIAATLIPEAAKSKLLPKLERAQNLIRLFSHIFKRDESTRDLAEEKLFAEIHVGIKQALRVIHENTVELTQMKKQLENTLEIGSYSGKWSSKGATSDQAEEKASEQGPVRRYSFGR